MADLVKDEKGDMVPEKPVEGKVEQKKEFTTEVIRGNVEVVMIKLMESQQNILLKIQATLEKIEQNTRK